MRPLLTTQNLPLLLLLLQPLPLPVLMLRKYADIPEDLEEEFEDYLSELYSTGPTKLPTKKIFERQVIIDGEEPIHDPNFCNYAVTTKNVHSRFKCRKEHFFLQAEYEDLQKACSTSFVECKNGVKRCHKSMAITEGVYCKFIHGTKMPDCEYTSSYRKGYPIITCQWQNEIESFTPDYVNNILGVSDKQKIASH